jgi:hypothetical protein
MSQLPRGAAAPGGPLEHAHAVASRSGASGLPVHVRRWPVALVAVLLVCAGYAWRGQGVAQPAPMPVVAELPALPPPPETIRPALAARAGAGATARAGAIIQSSAAAPCRAGLRLTIHVEFLVISDATQLDMMKSSISLDNLESKLQLDAGETSVSAFGQRHGVEGGERQERRSALPSSRSRGKTMIQ